ncbi:hypothetical protein [Pseudomonas luteola]|uniref:Uncharacterized protein n=1 Tax=Pseudomonas luteola TaxID=47886 RepID=A0ABS0MTN4_PSELU|nr:hypothetical protein [Pseudomonas luteola]MBH3440085.1 hypothetical protein [Pseudomonas luteola]
MKNEENITRNQENIIGKLKSESIPFAAILLALCIAKGYAYLEKFNQLLGIPVTRLGFDSYIYAIYGGVSFYAALLIGGIFLTLSLAFSSIISLTEKPKETSSAYREKSLLAPTRIRKAKPFIIAALAIALFTLVVYTAFGLVISDSQKTAQRAAYKEITNCEIASIKLKNTDIIKACIVGESDDMLYLAIKTDEKDGVVSFDKIMQPKDAVESVRQRSSIKK